MSDRINHPAHAGRCSRVSDLINHPAHYTSLPSGVEAIDVTEHFNFNLGNALKYILRADHKGAAEADLLKAAWYLDREIKRRAKYESSALA